MGWRTVLISGRAKLDLKLNNMVVRKEETVKIHIPEIAIIIIDSTTVSITTALIERLVEEKIKIIFSGRQHHPIAEVVNYYNKHNSVAIIKKQLAWTEVNKKKIWTEIIKEKIKNQALLTGKYNEENADLMLQYILEMKDGDISNREGHAAKLHFNSLFGRNFTRDYDIPTNAMLNYGYSILLSTFNREISSAGYLTQLGIFHDNQFNYFNLASDLMEPLRPLIDRLVLDYQPQKFGKEEKIAVLQIFEESLYIGKVKYTLLNAIGEYTKSVFQAIEEGNVNLIKFIEYEL